LTYLLILALVAPAQADRTPLEPGWNIFSPEQDVEIGSQVAEQADRALQLIADRQTADYINELGKRLASNAPGEKYPYQFKVVNDKTINAFALPGGFIYINRGTIETAQKRGAIGQCCCS
jgi:predicted Zn-dependent protease